MHGSTLPPALHLRPTRQDLDAMRPSVSKVPQHTACEVMSQATECTTVVHCPSQTNRPKLHVKAQGAGLRSGAAATCAKVWHQLLKPPAKAVCVLSALHPPLAISRQGRCSWCRTRSCNRHTNTTSATDMPQCTPGAEGHPTGYTQQTPPQPAAAARAPANVSGPPQLLTQHAAAP